MFWTGIFPFLYIFWFQSSLSPESVHSSSAVRTSCYVIGQNAFAPGGAHLLSNKTSYGWNDAYYIRAINTKMRVSVSTNTLGGIGVLSQIFIKHDDVYYCISIFVRSIVFSTSIYVDFSVLYIHFLWMLSKLFFNSLAPGRCSCHFKLAFFEVISRIDISDISFQIDPGECHKISLKINQHWFR